jgi:PII-like signaling protein
MNKRTQLSIYLNETDLSGELALCEVIVRRLLHLHIAGATVIRGVMGFGKHERVHRQRLFGVTDDRPILIVAVDEPEKIRQVLPEIRSLAPESLFTLQEVEAA